MKRRQNITLRIHAEERCKRLREALNATGVHHLLEDGVLHVGSFKEKYRHLVDAELMSDVQILHELGRAKLGQLRETYERRTQS